MYQEYVAPSQRHRASIESLEVNQRSAGHILALGLFDPEQQPIEELAEIADALGSAPDSHAKIASAEMFRELSTLADSEYALSFEMVAQQGFLRVASLYTNNGQPEHVNAVRAQKHLAYGHTYGWHAVYGGETLTPEFINRKTYQNLITVAAGASATLTSPESTPHQRQYFSGELAELSILLLLQRAAIKIGSETYWPYPALFTQDNGVVDYSNGAVRNNWDISIMTHIDEDSAPDHTYSLQVKTQRNARTRSKQYAEGISLVYVKDIVRDHQAPKESVSSVVVRHLLDEAEGQSQATAALDSMTEVLLDKIDE